MGASWVADRLWERLEIGAGIARVADHGLMARRGDYVPAQKKYPDVI
jgi:hypothetical protein